MRQQFEPKLDAEGLRGVYELEKALVPIVHEMERKGLRIDLSLIGTLQTEVSAECARIEQEIYEVLPAGAHLIAQVHDEFIVECREEDAEGVRDLMAKIMTTAPDNFTIPLKVDAHIVNNWGEAK